MSILPQSLRRAFAAWRSPRIEDRLWLEQRLASHGLTGPVVKFWKRLWARTPAHYVAMQQRAYERRAAADQITPGKIEGDWVVGSWREHDEWPDYEEYLMKYVPKEPVWVALDFGCGPGRNIRRWSHRFTRIDGADISERNLANARIFLVDLPEEKKPQLFVTGGMDCGNAPRNTYDFVFSTICLQHICVHSVRYSILRSMFECLKPGGRLSIQMGFGPKSPPMAAYDEDAVAALGTNSLHDVAVESPEQVRGDVDSIGLIQFEHWIRPAGPGDQHTQWIFFTAVKPQ